MIFAKEMVRIWGLKHSGEEMVQKVVFGQTDKSTYKFQSGGGSGFFNYQKMRWYDCVNEQWRVTDELPLFGEFIIDLATGNVDIDVHFHRRKTLVV
ncbi:hypothetical protein [Brevibacillus brevis]|uniref:Uncharacterized protein n=1 Tax=Brevibacillus brevis TaxID=1393 RepID=A0ABY9T469_BREBE|nr:hypothetical protein [Brevibacillus brevis]WNC14880.1 hypothetical protein RGB73_00315 [Brevibacillus brevis]